MKKIIPGLLSLLSILFFYSCSGPLYEPGQLAGKTVMIPDQDITDSSEGFWKMSDVISLYYFTKGKGTPVLMIHGGPGYPFGYTWKGLDSLCTDYRFYYYHQRGCGKSTIPVDRFESRNYYQNMMELENSLGIPTQLMDIESIRQILGKEKLILIGHSFGGFFASLYTIEYPQNVKALILVSPADVIKMPSVTGGLYDQVQSLLPDEMLDEYQDYLKRFFDYKNIFKKSETELSELNNEFIRYHAIASEKTGDKIVPADADLKSGGWHMHACFFSMGKKHDYTEAFKDIDIPTLIIHGSNDIMPLEATKVYADLIQNSRLEIIEDAGHFSFYAQPERFGKIVKEFLDSL